LLHYKKLLNNCKEIHEALVPFSTRAFLFFVVVGGNMSDFSIATKLVHAGERRQSPSGVPASTPIYATFSFIHERLEDFDRIVEGEVTICLQPVRQPDGRGFRGSDGLIEKRQFAFASVRNGRDTRGVVGM
jgi:hypothetical protein